MEPLLRVLCYIEKDGAYLMMHRGGRDNDINAGKWTGVGGYFEEDDESPEECLHNRVPEETGLFPFSCRYRGGVTISSAGRPQAIFLYTTDCFGGTLTDCDKGKLAWIPKDQVLKLDLGEEDRIFLRLLLKDISWFELELSYEGGTLRYAALDGKELKNFD